MKQIRRKWDVLISLVLLLTVFCGAYAEKSTSDHLQNAEPELNQTETTMSSEEQAALSPETVTPNDSNGTMNEYYDSLTGFSMQYPAFFVFDETQPGNKAYTNDRKASLTIENMPNEGNLTAEMMLEAIGLETPDAKPEVYDQNNCLRTDLLLENGETYETRLYLIREKSFHLVTLRYAAGERDKFLLYIDEMINSMGTDQADLG